MPAYYLVDVREVKDSATMQDYRARINPVVERFGGRFVVTGGPVQVVEGWYEPVFPLMIEFSSMEEYRELKGLRLSATVSNAFFMKGTPTSR